VLYLDGKEVSRISGTSGWAAKSVTLTAGRHTLLWVYRKDAADFAGADCAWVDQVRLTTAAETVTAPGAPSGPGEGLSETPYAYEALGAHSDKGHELEYRFDWGDGVLSPWSSSPSGEHTWGSAGTYRVVAQARCRSEHASASAFSTPTEVSIRLLVENVAAPLVPAGSSAAFAGVAASFATGGGESDLGHALQYRFDWGDGSRSAWSVDPGREHAWPSSGVFEVRAQARCAMHAAKESGWSEALLVAVSLPPEAVDAPLRPAGPAGAKTGSAVRFVLGGAASNRGHAVEYRVDWGDGIVSDWGAGTSATHAWGAAGVYPVAAQARCAEDPDVESPWSPAAEVAVSDHHDLAEALDNTALEWETGGDAVWTPLALGNAAGGDSARSGRLAAYRNSWVETTVEGPTSLYFLWRVASEAGRDRLVFSLDGVEQRRIAGTTPWLFGSARVEEGAHRLQWRFTRGSRLTAVPHHAWLDLVVDDPREIAGSIEVLSPAGGESWARGRTVALRWSSAGTIGPAVALQLLRRTPDGAWTARTIAPAVPDTGSWNWKVPAFLVPGVRYRVRVVSCAGPSIRGISQGSFTVR
jgi:hypothetical protein